MCTSVWATTEPIDADAAAAKKVVMATSGIDGASLFHDLVPGADAPASSVVAILAAADAISTWLAAGNTITNVIGYSLFQGEAWDTVGSRRFVYDISRYQDQNRCNNTVKASESPTGRDMCLSPLLPSMAFSSFGSNLEKLSAVVAVDQVGRGNQLYVHADTAAGGAGGVPSSPNLTPASSTQLPPSPVDSFKKRNAALPGYVLSGYDKNFTNPYYHSQFDTLDAATAVPNVEKAAQELAKTLVWLANDKNGALPNDIVINTTLVSDLMTCITGNWLCPLFNEYLADTYANMEAYLNAAELQFNLAPTTNATAPSLYASVASIKRIPPTLPYVTLTVEDIANFVFSLPKCAPGETVTPTKELCMYCDSDGSSGDDCSFKSKKALMQNIHVVTFPANVYEGFLRSFLVDKSTSNRTNIGCNATLDCRKNGAVGTEFECHRHKCVLPSAYFHTAISPALDPTPNGMIYNVNEKLCEGDDAWICSQDKNGKRVEMLWTEPDWSSDIGVTIYPDGGDSIAWVALVLGFLVLGSGYFAAKFSLSALQKKKML
jgi:hypothetical protein